MSYAFNAKTVGLGIFIGVVLSVLITVARGSAVMQYPDRTGVQTRAESALDSDIEITPVAPQALDGTLGGSRLP